MTATRLPSFGRPDTPGLRYNPGVAATVSWGIVLFDLDGTLIDSIPLIRESLGHTLRAHGFDVPPDDVLLSGVGRPLEAQMTRWARDTEEALAMTETYRAHNLTIHDDWVRPFDGIEPVLEASCAAGARLGVVTSKRSDGAHRGLEVTGLARWFSVLVGSDHVRNGKPDREPIDRALAALGPGEPDRVVYVGDAVHDVEAAQAAGIDSIGVTWGVGDADRLAAARPTHLVESREQLLARLTATGEDP